MRVRLGLLLLAISVGGNAVADVRIPDRVRRGGTLRLGEPMPYAKSGRNFAVMVDTQDVGGTLHQGSAIETLADTWSYRTQPWPEADVVLVFTTTYDDYYLAYYAPFANDIKGLGYKQYLTELYGQPMPDEFDDAPGDFSGIVVANSYSLYLQHPYLLPLVVLQELGHKWCCFVRESGGKASNKELLGRDEAHWSYFIDSDASPMEGNEWRDNADGSFTTGSAAIYDAGNYATPFSKMDLYLMGLAPSTDVPPFMLIQDPVVGTQRDDYGDIINPGSGPSMQRDVTITGTRRDVTIDDVIAATGPRLPATWDGQLRVAFVLVATPDKVENAVLMQQMASLVDRSETIWAEATGGRSHIINVTKATFGGVGATCDGAQLGCGDGLDCVAMGGSSTCVARCTSSCDGQECCLDTGGGLKHCVAPGELACTPHDTGDRCGDGIPCAPGAVCQLADGWNVSYCAGPCAGDPDCPAGMECTDSLCAYTTAPPGATGAECTVPEDCDSALCAGGHCVSLCDPAAPMCAPGTSCIAAAGGQSVCALDEGGGGGGGCGCAAAGPSRLPVGVAFAFALVALGALGVWIRRRT